MAPLAEDLSSDPSTHSRQLLWKIQSFLWPLETPAHTRQRNTHEYINKKKSFRKKKVDLRKFDFEYIVRIKDADRVLKVLYPGLSISAGSQITSFFRRGDEKLTLNLLADTIRYNDIILLSPEVHMEGDPRRLKLNCSTDKVVYSSGYQLFNLRNELTLEDNNLDNRLSWCNWEYSTYSGVLAASVIFRPSEKRGYTTEIKVHPGVM